MVTGEFLVEGGIQLPSGTDFSAPVHGLFLGGLHDPDPPLEFSEFHIEASELRLTHYRQGFFVTESGVKVFRPASENEAPHTFRNVTITLRGPVQKGYLAVSGTPDLSLASFLSDGPLEVAAVSRSEFSATTTAGETSRESVGHTQVFDFPHVATQVPGHLVFQGAASVKLQGVTLHVAHDGRDETFRTGIWRTSGSTPSPLPFEPAWMEDTEWVILDGTDMRLTVASPLPWQVVAPDATVEWRGNSTFWAFSGNLSTSGGDQSVSTRPVFIEGALGGTISAVEEGGNVRSRLRVQGELGGASAQMATPAGAGFPFVLLGMILGVVAGTAGGFLAWRRWGVETRPASSPESPAVLTPAHAAEYYVGLAEQCIQFEDYARALHWITLAREASPTSANVVTTMAYVLGELGQYDEALAAYAEASAMDPTDGEADLNAARLAAQAGKPLDLVETLVLRALERTPECVFDVEEDPEFRPLAERETFRTALLSAWQRWGQDETQVSR